jgi:hypothetical protein
MHVSLISDELVLYLANVVAVARVDGLLAPGEETAIEVIRVELGAKKGDLTRAVRMAESPDFVPKPVGRFSDRICNLEDMLFVSLVDDNLPEQERALLLTFSRAIGLSDEQLRTMLPEVKARVALAKGKATCPSCGTSVQAGVRFCPQCGAAQGADVAAAAMATELSIPPHGWAITFADSTGASFPKALEIARAAPTSQTALVAKKNWYLAGWPDSEFALVVNLAEEMSGLRNRRVFHDGAELDWQEVFHFTWCATQRAQAFRPPEYCFGKNDNRLNPWGCRMANLEWTDWAAWFTYGAYEKASSTGLQAVWVFDKERIRHEVQTALHEVRFCPHLRPLLASAVVDALPARVIVASTGPWKFRHAAEGQPGAIKVTEVSGTGDFKFTNEYWSFGVTSGSPEALREVLATAFAKVGISDITVRELVPYPLTDPPDVPLPPPD